ncbi:MAG: sulfatase [Candidatus Brocadiia bacterium]
MLQPKHLAVLLCLTAGLMLLLSGCTDEAPAPERPDVILYTIETLRKDHCSLYGYERDTTPFLRKLADECYVFEDAYSSSSWTRPSIVSLLTGLYPTEHGAQSYKAKLVEPIVTLPELLSAAGYETAGFLSNFNVTRERWQCRQGFQTFVDEGIKPAHLLLPDVNRWLDQRQGEQPFFLYIHTYDPHHNYNAPGQFRDMFAGDYSGPLRERADLRPSVFRERKDWSEEERRYIQARYDGEIAFSDAMLSRFVAYLRAEGLWENSLFILTADHGEGFEERGYWGHGFSVFPEQVSVPLIIKLPGQAQGGRVAGPVGGIDVLPTILDVLEFRYEGPVSGQSLLPALEGGLTARDRVFCEYSDTHAWRPGSRVQSFALATADAYYIEETWPDASHERYLYDRQADPEGLDDLTESRPEAADEYAHLLQQWRERNQPLVTDESPELDLDEEAIRELRDLGYL